MLNDYINAIWNFQEYLHSKKSPIDILWLYSGWMSNSVPFNIAVYVLSKRGLL